LGQNILVYKGSKIKLKDTETEDTQAEAKASSTQAKVLHLSWLFSVLSFPLQIQHRLVVRLLHASFFSRHGGLQNYNPIKGRNYQRGERS